MKKKIVIGFWVVMMLVSLGGCGTSNNSVASSENISENSGKHSTSKEEYLKMDDLSWNVEEGVVDGERYVLMKYINNSEYTICGYEMTFREKSGISQEEKEQFYTDVQEQFSLSDDDITTLKTQDISMHGGSDKVVNPGETNKNINCYYFGGSYYLRDLKHFEMVEPDILTIKYVDGDKIRTEYYDFTSKKYTAEDDTEKAVQWTSSELGTKVPKPDTKVIEAGRDDEIIFMFDAYGYSLDQFNTYVEECKKRGFTIEEGCFEGFYSADNEAGYNVYLYYNEDDDCMSGTIKSPDK